MTSKFQARRVLTLAALAMSAILASCAEAPAPTPPPAPIPAISLSPRVIEMASAYRYYVTRATAISPGFTDGTEVAQGVRIGAAYEPVQLLRGAIAYGAIAALQDPTYVATIRGFAGDAGQRRTMAYEIMKDPAYAVGLNGSASAAGLVMNALGDDGRNLLVQGRAVKQAAYTVQRSAWSKADVAGRDGRLQLAKSLSATPNVGDMAETSRLTTAVTGGGLNLVPMTASPPYTPLVIRSLAVAALSALGYADDASLEQVMPVMTEGGTASCLNMSKLNLYQCLAVSKPHYEDVFCLGQHIMMDTGACLMRGAGVAAPIEVRPEPLAVKAATVAVAPPKSRAKKR